MIFGLRRREEARWTCGQKDVLYTAPTWRLLKRLELRSGNSPTDR
jgi:hypothetical protein